jgi:outer membrane protein TolC
VRIAVLISALCMTTLMQAQRQLSLSDFLGRVERTHPSIISATYEPDLAEAEIRNALGRFDPDLSFSMAYKSSDGADKLNFIDGSLSLPLNTLFGPTIKAQYRRGIGSNVNQENATSTAGEAYAGVVLPLFPGIFTDRRRNELRKAMLRPEIAQAQYRIERNALLRSAALAYWSWAEAIGRVEIADSMVKLIEQRLQQVRARVQAGEEAAIDSVEVAQELYRRRGQAFEARRAEEQARVTVAVFLWSGSGIPQDVDFLPNVAMNVDTTADRTEVLRTASLQRPELLRMQKFTEMARYDSSLATEFLRPFIQAEASLASYNVDQWSSIDYRLGLSISQPLLFRSASANAQTATIGVQRADLSQMIVQRIVEADAERALVAVDRSRDRLSAAQTEVDLALQMIQAEQRKLVAGESTLLQINLRERFYAEAQLRLLAARADLARAIVDLRWATGTI